MSSKRPTPSRHETESSRGRTATAVQSVVQAETGHDQPSEWTDTIDDWEAVLSETGDSDAGATTDDERTMSTAPETDDERATSIVPETEFVRIDPISEATVEAAVDVLPEAWLADTDAQRLIQWVVHTFVEETNSALPTRVRIKSAIDRVADHTDLSPVVIRQVCTTTLYRDRSGAGKHNFQADLQTIESRTQ